MKKITFQLITASLLVVLSSTAFAQTPQQIFDRMIEQYTNSIEDIETMMMVTRMEGFMETEDPDTTYYRKVVTDGYPTMQVVSSGSETPATNYYNLQENYDALVENAQYEGTETVDGKEAHVLFFEDVSVLYDDMVTTPEDQQQQAEPQSGRMYIDAEDYIPLRMNFDIAFDGEYSGSADIQMKDIREVDGMLVPFLMEMKIEGISQEMSAEDLAEARQSMEDFEEQMENASGIQKRIMERTLKPQMERLQKILEEGAMTMKTITLDVQTNVTIPE